LSGWKIVPYRKNAGWNYSLPAALLLMAPFDILASLAMDIYLPVVPAMPENLDTTPAVIQLTLSLYMVMLGLGQVLFGPLSDRIGRRPVLIGGAALFAGTSFLLAGTSSPAAFVAFRLLQGVGASAALVGTFATVRDVYAERPEGVIIYGLFGSMLSFVPALGPIAGAAIARYFGWRAIFDTLGLLAMIAMLGAWSRWHETRPVPVGRRPAFRRILGSFAFWTYTLGASAAMGAFFVFFSTASLVLIDRAGLSGADFSLVFATAAVVMIATARFAKRFVTRWGIGGCLARGMAMLLLGALLLSVGQLAATPSFWTFIPPMWVIAIGIVLATSVTANGALQEFGDVAGAAVAVYSCVQSLVVGIVGSLFVLLLGNDTAWPLAGYAAVMSLVTLGTLRRLRSQAMCGVELRPMNGGS
jgi:DHA1 family florfenicol/chloramphenicol resistance protein-like MFS transporter